MLVVVFLSSCSDRIREEDEEGNIVNSSIVDAENNCEAKFAKCKKDCGLTTLVQAVSTPAQCFCPKKSGYIENLIGGYPCESPNAMCYYYSGALGVKPISHPPTRIPATVVPAVTTIDMSCLDSCTASLLNCYK
ncbi:hypothetical protein [Francisella adeliensis]|nr:hypothetical protein [Francisella adeliensis]MBK2084832.1 hypothetical protein [Francisella adeliensis]MBK2097225.1 hypothetical protein [Francisella adeliensis]QIW11703.1 hypothetical protein FZC43_03160 [Francisella adeliensis]QIW13577.1 hypothetical protein FZC44_03160 [Francisella adeliensis]